ncbi:ribonuclease H [Senna tora]|uniref:Ribonuclease H n=1 Tax=Senna tora TaxID=362788 RepID=A0A835CJT3_9FABA|nr:ribonuclease H [Senna tora]
MIEIQVNGLKTRTMLKNGGIDGYEPVSDTRWKAPPDGWVKINVDGSHMPSNNGISCWGVARNSKSGFVTLLKIWEEGQRFKQSFGELAQGINIESHLWKALANRIQELRSKNWNTVIAHIHREGNRVADLLPMSALKMPLGDKFLERAPDGHDKEADDGKVDGVGREKEDNVAFSNTHGKEKGGDGINDLPELCKGEVVIGGRIDETELLRYTPSSTNRSEAERCGERSKAEEIGKMRRVKLPNFT